MVTERTVTQGQNELSAAHWCRPLDDLNHLVGDWYAEVSALFGAFSIKRPDTVAQINLTPRHVSTLLATAGSQHHPLKCLGAGGIA